MWPDRRLLDLFGIEFPIVQAPMAGVMDAELVIAAAEGGGLGSLPSAMLTAEKAREQMQIIRQRVSAPINMNFFCHRPTESEAEEQAGGASGLVLITASTASIPMRPSAPPIARRSTRPCARSSKS